MTAVLPSVISVQCVVMTRRRTLSLMMTIILLDFTHDIWTLPAPGKVFMDSVNMKHMLRWPPLQAACNTTVLYSVQYQGEFELLLRRGSWMDAAECQQIPLPRCDLTFDLGSDSDYNLQVRAQCGSQLSPWTRLGPPFNRRDTVLKVPEMTVVSAGGGLQVWMDQLPLTAAASVTVWRKDDELQAVVYEMPAEQEVLHVAALQEGEVYCVRAQILLHSGLRSSSTDPHCVAIAGAHAAAWRRPTTVILTVIVVLGFLFAFFWSMVHGRPASCQTLFQKEQLPESLTGKIQIPRFDLEEGRPCEVVSIITELQAPETESTFTTGLEKPND